VIAKTLVEAHHGHIGVDSEVGRGSTFYFEVPVIRAQPSRVPTPTRQSTHDPAVAIDPQAIVDPTRRGVEGLLGELEGHLRDAAGGDDLDALADAQAAARILGTALPADAPAELRQSVAEIAQTLDEALRRGSPPNAERWAHLRRELLRVRTRLGLPPAGAGA
jgi:hypothetical protein